MALGEQHKLLRESVRKFARERLAPNAPQWDREKLFPRDEVAALSGAELDRVVAEEYWERFFGHCEGEPQLYAEGSVTYLYVPERMEPILKLWPEAKFVIALRDPLSMLPSLHARLLVTGDETIIAATRQARAMLCKADEINWQSMYSEEGYRLTEQAIRSCPDGSPPLACRP